MAEYSISCDEAYKNFYNLLVEGLLEKSDILDIEINKLRFCGRLYCKIKCAEYAFPSVVLLIRDMFKEILLVNFKHLYFVNFFKLKIFDKDLESLFYASITLYDREYDEELISIDRLCDKELAVDSIIRFCTVDLVRRWKGVVEILKENFSDGRDKDAIVEFVKHIIYSLPQKVGEVNIYKKDLGYSITDENGRNLATLAGSCNCGEIASRVIFMLPGKINFYDTPGGEGELFFRNIFSDKVNFFVDK